MVWSLDLLGNSHPGLIKGTSIGSSLDPSMGNCWAGKVEEASLEEQRNRLSVTVAG